MKIVLAPRKNEKQLMIMSTFLFDIMNMLILKGYYVDRRGIDKGYIEVKLDRRRLPCQDKE